MATPILSDPPAANNERALRSLGEEWEPAPSAPLDATARCRIRVQRHAAYRFNPKSINAIIPFPARPDTLISPQPSRSPSSRKRPLGSTITG
jgi:hypothetical protein